jgi:hypothetical protein
MSRKPKGEKEMTHQHEYILQKMSHDRIDEARRLAREMNIRKGLAEADHKNRRPLIKSLASIAQWLVRSTPQTAM